MALPPTIPTSFVPYSASAGQPRTLRPGTTDLFSYIAYGLLGIVMVLAVGLFIYDQILSSTDAGLKNSIAAEKDKIDTNKVDSFVKLSNQLAQGQQLLNGHLAYSHFFSMVEQVLPATVRLSTVHLTQASDRTIKLDGSGVAKSFNALAAFSNALATTGSINDAIFANISVSQKDNSVAFMFTATVDPKLVAYTVPTASVAAPTTGTSTVPASGTPPRTP